MTDIIDRLGWILRMPFDSNRYSLRRDDFVIPDRPQEPVHFGQRVRVHLRLGVEQEQAADRVLAQSLQERFHFQDEHGIALCHAASHVGGLDPEHNARVIVAGLGGRLNNVLRYLDEEGRTI